MELISIGEGRRRRLDLRFVEEPIAIGVPFLEQLVVDTVSYG